MLREVREQRNLGAREYPLEPLPEMATTIPPTISRSKDIKKETLYGREKKRWQPPVEFIYKLKRKKEKYGWNYYLRGHSL